MVKHSFRNWALATALVATPSMAQDNDGCQQILGDRATEGAFTVLEQAPLAIVVNGGQLKDVTISLPTDENTITFSQGGQSTTLDLGDSDVLLQGSATLAFGEQVHCAATGVDFSGARTLSIFCNATGIHVQDGNLIVDIQEGSEHVRKPTSATCMKTEPLPGPTP